jgi:quercetin dioxygenase-like cupin family protein
MTNPVVSASATAARRINEDWGSLSWLANQQIGNAQKLTLGRVVIKKGHSNPRHCHPNCEEVLYLLNGRLEHTLGDETLVLERGDTLAIPQGIFHSAVNIGAEDADTIVAYSSGVRQFVLESESTTT